jgi:hypothetical protein
MPSTNHPESTPDEQVKNSVPEIEPHTQIAGGGDKIHEVLQPDGKYTLYGVGPGGSIEAYHDILPERLEEMKEAATDVRKMAIKRLRH